MARIGYLVAAVAGLALVVSGCGSGSNESSASKRSGGSGKALFQEACGSCHALADAGTAGGINLDDLALTEAGVREQIARGGKGMPANLLDGADRDAVAKYVAAAAGND